MAGYMGYFFQSMQAGIQTGTQLLELKWKKDEKKKLEQKETELMEAASIFNSAVSTAGEDGFYSEDEKMKINAMYMALAYEVKDRVEGSYKAMQAMDKRVVEENKQWFDYIKEGIDGLDAKQIGTLFDFVEPSIKGEKGLLTLEALENIAKKKSEITPKAETFPTAAGVQEAYPKAGVKYTEEGYVPVIGEEGAPKAPSMADEKSAITILKTFANATPEQFANQRTILEQRTGLDLSVYTQDILKETGSEMLNLYNTPEEVMANVKAPKGLTVIPKRDTKSGKYYGSFSKETGVGGGGVDINDILFGTTGIMKDYIGTGSQLGDEQRAEIRNNYDIMKPSLDKETQKQVEEYLQQIGIDVSKAIPKPEIPLDIKKKPIWQASWKYYQGLNIEELYQLADKEDDKKAYEELKKRGKIQ